MDATSDERILLCYGDLKLLGIPYARSTLYRRMKAGTFPRAVRLGGNRIVWRRSEIIAFIEGLQPTGGTYAAPHRQGIRGDDQPDGDADDH
jgi:prophage regulatory protein